MFKKLIAYPNGEVIVESTVGTKVKLKYDLTHKAINECRSSYSNIPALSRESSDIDLFDDIDSRL